MTIGPKPNPRPIILHVDSETGIPYRLAESDELTIPNLTVTNINGASYTPGVGPGGIDPTAINVTSLQGTGTFFLTALTGTFVLTATTGVFATTSYVNDELAGYCGPGLGSPAQGDMAYYNGGWQKLPRGTVDQVLTIDGSPLLPTWKTSTGSVSIPVTINQGGSNYTGPYETNGLLYFNGTRFTSNTQLTFDGTTLDAPNLTLDNPLPVAQGGTGLTTIPTNNQVLYSNGSNLVGNSNLTFNGTTLTANTLNLTNSLTVAHGGTGRTSLNAGELLIGDGTNAVTYVSQNKFETTSYSRSNYLLTSVSVTGLNGTGVFTTTAFATANYFNKNSDTLPITRGGTGRTSFTDKYIPFYNNSTTSFGENGNLYFDSATTSLVSKTLVLVDALGTAYGGTGRTSFVTGAIYANSTTSIERHEGLTDLAGFADNNPYNPEYPNGPAGPYYYYPNYAALPFIGTTGRYVRLQTGQTPGGPSQYGKVLRLYDPGLPGIGAPGYVAEPRWEFITVGNLTDLNSSSVTPSAVSATYQYGSPFVWQYNSDDAAFNAQVTATNGWWGGLQLSSWVVDALLPELDNYYITDKTGYYPSANVSISSLTASSILTPSISATNYYNLPSATITWKEAQDIVLTVRNQTGATLAIGTPVTISGVQGDVPIVTILSAVATHVPEAYGFANHVAGLIHTSIGHNQNGHIVVEGIIEGTDAYPLNTNAFAAGDSLYVSSNGQLSNVRPSAPYESHPVGIVLRAHPNAGKILVKIENSPEINDIVGFNLASVLINGDLIAYDLTTSTFKNVQALDISGTSKFGTVSATTYLNLPAAFDLSTLNSYYVNVSGDSANAGFHFSSVSANGMFLSASVASATPLQIRFASGSTASHVVFASADGTEIARLNLRGTNNLFLGKSSGNSWSTGSNNVAIGHQASQFLSTGSDTVAIGSNANYNSTTSQRNTSIGSNAGGYPGTSTDNVNIGYFAGYTQTGSFNISIGPSVNYATVGARNVGVGYQALHRNTSGTGNIGLGYRAGYGFSSTATNNIAIGHDSNITEPTTFSNTIVIGSGIASTASNQTIIGHPQTSSTLIRGALSATSYVNAPLTSGTFSTGDVLYYNGSVWVKLAKPANPAVLLIDDLNGTGLPYWEEAPNTAPSTTYTLQVTTDGSNNPGAIFWG